MNVIFSFMLIAPGKPVVFSEATFPDGETARAAGQSIAVDNQQVIIVESHKVPEHIRRYDPNEPSRVDKN